MTLTKASIHQEELAAAIGEVVKTLAPLGVVRVKHELGYDWTGDPALFFRIVLTDEAVETAMRDGLAKATRKISWEIERKIEPLEEWGVLPYFSFRKESEQAGNNDPDWV